MTCEEIRRDASREEILRHREECAACRSDLDLFLRLESELKRHDLRASLDVRPRRRFGIPLAAAAALFVAAGATLWLASGNETGAGFVQVSGPVEMEIDGRILRPAQGQPIQAGTLLFVPDAASAELSLAGGRMKVLPNSRIRVEPREISMVLGKIDVETTRRAGIVVRTACGQVVPTGTRFVVEQRQISKENSMSQWTVIVTVLAGAVQLSGPQGTASAAAGQILVAQDDQPPQVKPAAQAPLAELLGQGHSIVFMAMEEGRKGTVYMATPGMKEPRAVSTFDKMVTQYRPYAWSPDGKRIVLAKKVYEQIQGWHDNFNLYVVDPREERRISRRETADHDPSWSPDGLHVVYSEYSLFGICFRDAASGSNEKVVKQGMKVKSVTPVWSPDGRKIAFADRGIRIVDPDGRNEEALTETKAWDHYPAWSPDSKTILFTSTDENDHEVCVVEVATKKKTPLTKSKGFDGMPVWSPDGRKIAFVSARDGNREIYVMNADGSEPVNLTRNKSVDEMPCWSPDGKHILFISDRDGNREVYAMRSDGADPRRLTDSPDDEHWPLFAPVPGRPVPADRLLANHVRDLKLTDEEKQQIAPEFKSIDGRGTAKLFHPARRYLLDGKPWRPVLVVDAERFRVAELSGFEELREYLKPAGEIRETFLQMIALLDGSAISDPAKLSVSEKMQEDGTRLATAVLLSAVIGPGAGEQTRKEWTMKLGREGRILEFKLASSVSNEVPVKEK
jgi:Tol biopolymer transport system component